MRRLSFGLLILLAAFRASAPVANANTFVRTLAPKEHQVHHLGAPELITHPVTRSLAVHPQTGEIFFIGERQILKLSADQTTVVPIAGTGERGDFADGDGLTIPIEPQELAFGRGNLLYFVDGDSAHGENSRIRTVSANGDVKTVAGTAKTKFNGDGLARVTNISPTGLTYDASSASLFFIDGNERIRALEQSDHEPAPHITTLVGVPRDERADEDNSSQSSEEDLETPSQILIDPTTADVYFVDRNGARIQRIDWAAKSAVPVAGSPAGRDGDGRALDAKINIGCAVFDQHGFLFIADGNQTIRRLDLQQGIITTIAGITGRMVPGNELPPDGPANTTSISPVSLLFDGDGNLNFYDLNHRIRRIEFAEDPDTPGFIRTIAGTGATEFNRDAEARVTNIAPEQLLLAGDKLLFGERRRIRLVENR